jgi:coenzyme F420 hydrogenase subunit delta
MYLDLFNKDILVVGCGNPLLGDDGFGPAVIESLEIQQIQADHIGLLDAGTSVRELLFDLLLSSPIPKNLILIDAVQHSNALPGDIITIDVDQIPENKVADYSLHQFPTTNMLKELRDSGLIDIKIYAVQVETIPKLVKPGLSRPVKKAVLKLSNLIKLKIYDENFLSCDREFV